MEKIRELLSQAIAETFSVELEPRIEPSAHADFTSNVAMQLAGKIGQNPRVIGEQLVEVLRDKGVEVELAGPGFLNFRLSDAGLVKTLVESVKDFDGYYGYAKYAGKKVVTEFSDPNPFKVLHVGHLYTSIVGDAISNLIEVAGGKVHRVNFGGDVGLHVAKTMWAIKQRMGGKFSVSKLPTGALPLRMNWMAECYVEGTKAYDDDEKAIAEIVEINKAIYKVSTSGDKKSPIAKVYWKCRTWSYESFNVFYEHIGVKFEKYYPESTVAELGLKTVKAHVPKVYQESEGAIVFRGEPYGLHTRVFVNAQGLPTYEAKDVGLLMQKWEDYRFDESVVITGADITEYMKVVLKSVEQFEPKLVERTRHIVHGNVILPGAVKMSSRKGNFLRAAEVLDMVSAEEKRAFGKEAVERMQKRRLAFLKAMLSRMLELSFLKGKRVQKGKFDLSWAIVSGAAKYAFLKSKIEPGNIIFDIKESVNLHGNSGPYLQYSLARAKSILRKVEPSDKKIDDVELDEYERDLLLFLLEWKDVLVRSVDELAPHRVCTYLYELAQKFSRFYEHDRVAGDEKEQLRKQLVQGYVGVMEAGLKILGVPSVERV